VLCSRNATVAYSLSVTTLCSSYSKPSPLPSAVALSFGLALALPSYLSLSHPDFLYSSYSAPSVPPLQPSTSPSVVCPSVSHPLTAAPSSIPLLQPSPSSSALCPSLGLARASPSYGTLLQIDVPCSPYSAPSVPPLQSPPSPSPSPSFGPALASPQTIPFHMRIQLQEVLQRLTQQRIVFPCLLNVTPINQASGDV
jgi:hypothetical protein